MTPEEVRDIFKEGLWTEDEDSPQVIKLFGSSVNSVDGIRLKFTNEDVPAASEYFQVTIDLTPDQTFFEIRGLGDSEKLKRIADFLEFS